MHVQYGLGSRASRNVGLRLAKLRAKYTTIWSRNHYLNHKGEIACWYETDSICEWFCGPDWQARVARSRITDLDAHRMGKPATRWQNIRLRMKETYGKRQDNDNRNGD